MSELMNLDWTPLIRLIGVVYFAVLAGIFYHRWKRTERRVKELEGELPEKPKRKNNKVDPAYHWVIQPSKVKIEEIPAHQWKDDDERRRFFTRLRVSDSVPDERPIPFPTKRLK